MGMGFKEYHKCQNNMGQLWAKIRSQQWVEIGLGLKQYHKSQIQVMGQQRAKTKVASFMGCFFFFFFFSISTYLPSFFFLHHKDHHYTHKQP
jgi:hypothetical protein